jgi:hypothetical protein
MKKNCVDVCYFIDSHVDSFGWFGEEGECPKINPACRGEPVRWLMIFGSRPGRVDFFISLCKGHLGPDPKEHGDGAREITREEALIAEVMFQ